jgi:hypothetical protein
VAGHLRLYTSDLERHDAVDNKTLDAPRGEAAEHLPHRSLRLVRVIPAERGLAIVLPVSCSAAASSAPSLVWSIDEVSEARMRKPDTSLEAHDTCREAEEGVLVLARASWYAAEAGEARDSRSSRGREDEGGEKIEQKREKAGVQAGERAVQERSGLDRAQGVVQGDTGAEERRGSDVARTDLLGMVSSVYWSEEGFNFIKKRFARDSAIQLQAHTHTHTHTGTGCVATDIWHTDYPADTH